MATPITNQATATTTVQPTWALDPAHSAVEFSAKHMMITTVRGRFNKFDVKLNLDEKEPTKLGKLMRKKRIGLVRLLNDCVAQAREILRSERGFFNLRVDAEINHEPTRNSTNRCNSIPIQSYFVFAS